MELKETAVYYLEDVEGISAISFVDNPATRVEWFKFNDDEVELEFSKNEMERIVTGPIMLAETPMWRGKMNAYVKFSADQIRKMAKKTFMNGGLKFNENHDQSKPIEKVHLIESFFVGDKAQSKLYGNLPEGTWMGSFFIEDEDYWNNVIMSDKFKGFSLEGNFKPVLDEKIIEERFSDITMILDSDLDDDTKYDSIKSLLMDFGCPPKGDGKTKKGEPDKRCRDESKNASGGSKAKKKAPVKSTKEQALENFSERSFENPVTAEDIKNTGLYNDKSEREQIQYTNKLYNTEHEKAITKEFGEMIYGQDHTWDYDKGQPSPKPKLPANRDDLEVVRSTRKERRSREDIEEGYPKYKVTVDWVTQRKD